MLLPTPPLSEATNMGAPVEGSKLERQRRRPKAEIATLVAYKQRCLAHQPAKLDQKRLPHNTWAGPAGAWKTWSRAASMVKELVATWKARVGDTFDSNSFVLNNATHAVRLRVWGEQIKLIIMIHHFYNTSHIRGSFILICQPN